MAKRLWFVRTRRIVTQYSITDLRARLAAALWELRRLRRELNRAWGIVDELPLLTTLRAEDDYMAAKTQLHAMPAAMPAAGQADDGARKTQSDGTRTQCNVTTWSEEE